MRRFRTLGLTALASALLSGGCFDFHLAGPEDPPALSTPRLVTVRVEYRQVPGCAGGGRCDDNVVFFGSWMKPGTEFFLTPEPGNYVWRGVAYGVPVNYPPHENPEPYQVRIYDPHLFATPTQGFTADRLVVGGESLWKIESPGGANVHALVYIDDDGVGHNAY
jgi:hypothetical protein